MVGRYFYKVCCDVMNQIAVPWLCHDHNSWVGRHVIRGSFASSAARHDWTLVLMPLSPRMGLQLLKIAIELRNRQSLVPGSVPLKILLYTGIMVQLWRRSAWHFLELGRVVTSRKRSLGQGSIFTSVCHSFCHVTCDACWEANPPTPRGSASRKWEDPPSQHDGIQWISGRYASYWNAFLLRHVLIDFQTWALS